MSGKISVIMATYNCEETVAESIQSIIKQTYENWELIVCDDGSTDGTFEILKGFQEKMPEQFVLIKNEKNQMLPYSLNRCLEKVTGQYVARMDADDLSAPTRFEKQVAFLQGHPDIDMVGTGIVVSDGNKIVGTIVKPPRPTKLDMIHASCFSHATIMTYPYVYEKLNGYSLDPSVIRVEDMDLWFRFFAAGFYGDNIPDLLYTVLEDTNTMHRRGLQDRINGAKTKLRGFKLVGISKKYYIYPIIKVIVGFVPKRIYQWIHFKRLQ